MLIVHKISDHTRRSRDHNAAKEGADETNDDQSRDRLCERAGDDQDGENGQASHAHWFTTVYFAQWGHEHGSNGQADEIESQA